jgi:hypothetical protein
LFRVVADPRRTDKTHEAYSRPLAVFLARRDYTQQRLAVLNPQLMAISSELAKIQEDQCLSESPASKARAEKLAMEKTKILNEMVELQETYHRGPIAFHIQTLEQQRAFLLSGRDTPLESV